MTNIEMAMAAPVLPAETNAARLAVAHQLGGDAQRGIALAAERHRGALGHAHDLGGVADLDAETLGAEPTRASLDGLTVADEDDGRAELADGDDRAFHHHGGPWSPPMASTGDFHGCPGRRPNARLDRFDSGDLAALVVPAVRADAVRQLGLATLRAHRARGLGQLVVGCGACARGRASDVAWAAAWDGCPFSQFASRCGQVAERGQARVGRALYRTCTA
jgi:hypothetical protein